ncbi:MAG: hypothetical protein IJS68_00500 [Clostridia bacterium]|nr:hypothetical protein [Clostridia bacterium]
MKNSVIVSIILSVVLTLTLAISTLASVLGPGKPEVPNVYLAYRTNDECVELKEYKEITFGFDTLDAEAVITYDAETQKYTASKATEAPITATAKDDAGKNYNLTIEIFAQGDGSSAETPWVVANANHIVELSDLINDDDATNDPAFVELKADVNMAKVADFIPIGNDNHRYAGTFNGNGKTISNLTINVTKDNVANYLVKVDDSGTDRGSVELGLFGCADGATIKNVAMDRAYIAIAEDVKTLSSEELAALEVANLQRVSVGALVADAVSTQIIAENNETINATLKGYSFSDRTVGLWSNGVGGVAGSATYGTTISGYAVSAYTDARAAYDVNNYDGAYYAGVVGYTYGTSTEKVIIQNVEVTLTGDVNYVGHEYIGGVVAYAHAYTDVDSVNVKGIGLAGSERFADIVSQAAEIEAKGANIGGVAEYLAPTSTLTNAQVSNASIDVKASVGGVVCTNNGGTISNATFSGNIVAAKAAGVALQNINNGRIEYTAEFAGLAVNGSVKGVYAAGLVGKNTAGAVVTADSENKATVNVVVKSPSGSAVEPEAILDEAYTAGLAWNNEGTIENLRVTATVADGINMAGLVNTLGGVLQNVEANVAITSYNTKTNSTTYSIAGAVGEAKSGAEVKNNVLVVNVNKNALSDHKYGAAVIGGLVGQVSADDVAITGNTVSGSIFANYAKYLRTLTIGENDYSVNTINVGGLVAVIADGDQYNTLAVSALNISDNTVSDLVIDVNYNADNIPLVKNLDESLNSTLIKFRNIGYTVGLVSATGSLDLSNNELTNVTVRAYKKAFTTNNIENTEYTRYPNAYSYNKNGGVDVTDVADKTTATFVAYDD